MTAQQLAHVGVGKCKVEGCNNLTSEVYCARCEEEITGQPYPLANVLHLPSALDLARAIIQKITRRKLCR